MGTMRVGLLLAALTALFMGAGYLLGQAQGMFTAFLMALAMNAFAYWNSDTMVLRMYNARPVGPHDAPEFHDIVAGLAQRAGLPMPKVFIIQNDQPNAFATGRDPEHAAVAATTGLLRLLDREEVAAVMAHELGHVKNRDTLVMTVTATLAGAVGMLASFAFFLGGGHNNRNNPLGLVGVLLVTILAPVMAMLVQLAISRAREYGADADGAAICGNPLALASALRKLDQGARHIDNPAAEANPATAHLFIVNPLHGGAADSLFATHPSVANRVARLEALAGRSGVAAPVRPTGVVPGSAPAHRPGPWG